MERGGRGEAVGKGGGQRVWFGVEGEVAVAERAFSSSSLSASKKTCTGGLTTFRVFAMNSGGRACVASSAFVSSRKGVSCARELRVLRGGGMRLNWMDVAVRLRMGTDRRRWRYGGGAIDLDITNE